LMEAALLAKGKLSLILFNQRCVSSATSHVRLAIMLMSAKLVPRIRARTILEKTLDSASAKK